MRGSVLDEEWDAPVLVGVDQMRCQKITGLQNQNCRRLTGTMLCLGSGSMVILINTGIKRETAVCELLISYSFRGHTQTGVTIQERRSNNCPLRVL
jgi:hypothetical protein